MEEVESEQNELNKQCLYRKNSENPFFRQRNGAAAATQCRMWPDLGQLMKKSIAIALSINCPKKYCNSIKH